MNAPADAPRSRIAAHTLLSMIAVLALGLTRLIFALLVAKQLGADVLGTVNTQLSIATFASLAFASSTSISAAKFVPAALGGASESEARRALLALLRWCVLGTAAITIVLALTLSWLLTKLSLAEVAATCVLFVAYSAYLFVRGAMYGYGKVRRYAALETLCDCVAIASAVLVVLFGADLILLLPFIVGYTLFAVFGWLSLPRPARTAAPAATLRPELRQEMRGYTGWGALGISASTGLLQLSMVFAYQFNSEFDAGLYAAAFNLTVPAVFVPRALSLAMFPAMAGAFGRGDAAEVRRQLGASTRFLLLGTLPFFAAGVFLAEPILTLSFGPEFAGAHRELELLLAATYIVVLAIPSVNALGATHRALVRVPALAALAGLIVGLVGWIVLGPTYGTTGIAVGYLAGVVVASGTDLIAAWRQWRLPWSMLFLRAGLAVGAAVVLRLLAAQTGNGVLVRLGCSLAVAAVTALLCLPELRQLLRRLPAYAAQASGKPSR